MIKKKNNIRGKIVVFPTIFAHLFNFTMKRLCENFQSDKVSFLPCFTKPLIKNLRGCGFKILTFREIDVHQRTASRAANRRSSRPIAEVRRKSAKEKGIPNTTVDITKRE